MQTKIIVIGTGILLLLGIIAIGVRQAGIPKLAGGPEGGTFLNFSRELATLLEANNPNYKFHVLNTGGSVENIKLVNKHEAVLALAHAGDIFLAYNGKLENEPERFDHIRALGRVFGSTAQLAVLNESIIRTPNDLANRRVAIGSVGSGAAHTAERYFRSIGIWDYITPLYIGYDLGMSELSSGRAEAVWQMVGTPSPSIQQLNRKHPLRLIPLDTYPGFYERFPFYSEATIPAGTYRGQKDPVPTFQDNSILITYENADPDLIRTTLKLIYGETGQRRLRTLYSVSSELDISKGLQGIKIPLHPVAEAFWKAKGQL